MFTRLTAPALDGLRLDLTERDLVADLDPGWLDWQFVRESELTRAA